MSAVHSLRAGQGATARSFGRRGGRSQLSVKAVSTPLPPTSKGRNVEHGDTDPKYLDKLGRTIKAMPADYGFRSGSGRLYEEHYGEVPDNVWELASQNFKHELAQMRLSFRFNTYAEDFVKSNPPKTTMQKFNVQVGKAMAGLLGKVDEGLENLGLLPKLEAPEPLTETQKKEFAAILDKLHSLQLDNAGVAKREEERIAKHGDLQTPYAVKLPFLALCWVLDVVYNNRPIQKFWVLETVARIPYMAYISVLHLYESLGFYRAGAELRKVHFAEEWNETHHLQIMESLGGDQAWFDRFLADHAAIMYYWLLVGMYLVSPKLAYNFMQRVEHHAADTYTEFLETNREVLSTIPPPQVALNYYKGADLYLFDAFQQDHAAGQERRPECNNLLDVFINIRDDENEHVKTMAACQKDGVAKKLTSAQKFEKKRLN